jgi:hypothetical protein
MADNCGCEFCFIICIPHHKYCIKNHRNIITLLHKVSGYDFSGDMTKINTTKQNHHFVKAPLCYRRSEYHFQGFVDHTLFLVVFIAIDVIHAGRTSLRISRTFIK